MKYMLDTNIASFLIKGKSVTLDNKIKFVPVDDICISVITRAELLYGVAKVPQATRLKQQVNEFLNYITVLDWDNSASESYAIIRAELERQGKVIGSMDMQISAHAVSQNLILVTNNTKEFQRVNGLKIEDWTR